MWQTGEHNGEVADLDGDKGGDVADLEGDLDSKEGVLASELYGEV